MKDQRSSISVPAFRDVKYFDLKNKPCVDYETDYTKYGFILGSFINAVYYFDFDNKSAIKASIIQLVFTIFGNFFDTFNYNSKLSKKITEILYQKEERIRNFIRNKNNKREERLKMKKLVEESIDIIYNINALSEKINEYSIIINNISINMHKNYASYPKKYNNSLFLLGDIYVDSKNILLYKDIHKKMNKLEWEREKFIKNLNNIEINIDKLLY